MRTTTESAVVAIFGDSSAAQAAAAELVTNAFAGDRIHITSESQPTPSNHGSVQNPRVGDLQPDVKRWVESVFGHDSDTERQRYEEAVRNGKAVLEVSTPDQMVGKAADILNHHLPVETVLARVPQQLAPVLRNKSHLRPKSLGRRR
jgi:hypothetical protein